MGYKFSIIAYFFTQYAAKASSQVAAEAGKEQYSQAMDVLVGGDRPFLKTDTITDQHEKEKQRAFMLYSER